MGPKSEDVSLEGTAGEKTQTQKEACEDGGSDWSYARSRQAREDAGENSAPGASAGRATLPHCDFTLASRLRK